MRVVPDAFDLIGEGALRAAVEKLPSCGLREALGKALLALFHCLNEVWASILDGDGVSADAETALAAAERCRQVLAPYLPDVIPAWQLEAEPDEE